MTHSAGADVQHICHRYMNFHVIAHMRDGSQYDGIIQGMDADGVTMLIPEEIDAELDQNQAYRQPPYGRHRFRRYRPQRFPYNYLVFPFFVPYPYYYPLYPYSPYPGPYPY